MKMLFRLSRSEHSPLFFYYTNLAFDQMNMLRRHLGIRLYYIFPFIPLYFLLRIFDCFLQLSFLISQFKSFEAFTFKQCFFSTCSLKLQFNQPGHTKAGVNTIKYPPMLLKFDFIQPFCCCSLVCTKLISKCIMQTVRIKKHSFIAGSKKRANRCK